MKILRSINRRGFTVGPAGYFTVLRPNKWFAASLLPGRFHHPSGRFKGLAGLELPNQTIPYQADIQETPLLSQIAKTSAREHGRMRPALIALAALAITWLLLMWTMHP